MRTVGHLWRTCQCWYVGKLMSPCNMSDWCCVVTAAGFPDSPYHSMTHCVVRSCSSSFTLSHPPSLFKRKKAGEELQITSLQHRNMRVIPDVRKFCTHLVYAEFFSVLWHFLAICQYFGHYLKKTSIFPLPVMKHLKWKGSFTATA